MAGNSDFTPGVGYTANPRPDERLKRQFVPVFVGQPPVDFGRDGDLSIDTTNRKIYEKTAGAWSAGTAY